MTAVTETTSLLELAEGVGEDTPKGKNSACANLLRISQLVLLTRKSVQEDNPISLTAKATGSLLLEVLQFAAALDLDLIGCLQMAGSPQHDEGNSVLSV